MECYQVHCHFDWVVRCLIRACSKAKKELLVPPLWIDSQCLLALPPPHSSMLVTTKVDAIIHGCLSHPRKIVAKVLVMMGKGPMAWGTFSKQVGYDGWRPHGLGDLFKIRDLRQRYQKHVWGKKKKRKKSQDFYVRCS